jgi:hypothetical protein
VEEASTSKAAAAAAIPLAAWAACPAVNDEAKAHPAASPSKHHLHPTDTILNPTTTVRHFFFFRVHINYKVQLLSPGNFICKALDYTRGPLMREPMENIRTRITKYLSLALKLERF